jgi:hypothetical protein
MREIIKLLLQIVLFALPAMFVYVFPAYVYWKAGEFTPISQVVTKQRGSTEILFGLRYENVVREYKRELIADRKPEVIGFGTSRIMQMRDSFFTASTTFVNAGGAVTLLGQGGKSSIEHFKDFMAGMPAEYHPSLIMLSIDPFIFQSNRVIDDPYEADSVPQRLLAFFRGDWHRVYQTYSTGVFTLTGLSQRKQMSPSIGINALFDHTGFLNDGSLYWGAITENPDRRQVLADNLKTVASSTIDDRSTVEYSPVIRQQSLDDLQAFLEYCKENNIYVVGFLPPHPHIIYEALVAPHDATAETVVRLPKVLKAMFDARDYPFFDYSDGASIGIKDTEYLDDYHVSDKGQAQILADMASQSDTLRHYVSLQDLRKLIQNTPGDFILTQVPTTTSKYIAPRQ